MTKYLLFQNIDFLFIYFFVPVRVDYQHRIDDEMNLAIRKKN